MTVAAVILSSTTESALADTLGQPRVRRLVDIAWSGGALPVVVVAPDPDGAVTASLVGTEAVYGSPAPAETGPVGQMLRGAELARQEVSDISGVLLWPGRMTWVGPESITSLIEAHGVQAASMLRPGWHGEAGWPVLLPMASLDHLRAVAPDRMPPDVIDEVSRHVAMRVIEVGDPGVTMDVDTPFGDLPPYEGPPDPPGGHTHEWGEAVAERGVDEDVPGEGRGLAPYPQAADDAAVDLD
jgi:CTP:molybdopterin cytidylyltransferase MocA